jgi:hypothetical protein
MSWCSSQTTAPPRSVLALIELVCCSRHGCLARTSSLRREQSPRPSTAPHVGRVAAEVAAGLAGAFDRRVIPSVAYTDPEVAWVGVTENEAEARHRRGCRLHAFSAADALVLKLRKRGREQACKPAATGVPADGHREILGLQVTGAEEGASWRPPGRCAGHLRRALWAGRRSRRHAASSQMTPGGRGSTMVAEGIRPRSRSRSR